ncbi:rhomboid-like protein [Streptomyces sp. NBC_00728]|uniref:rhomboid-like protein n=1 Tax=Streptomyces sp. NBC_00728 TaxID=2903676 RepID=UPI0038670A60
MDRSTTERADTPTGRAGTSTGPAPGTPPPNLPGMPQQREGSTSAPAPHVPSAPTTTSAPAPGPAAAPGSAEAGCTRNMRGAAAAPRPSGRPGWTDVPGPRGLPGSAGASGAEAETETEAETEAGAEGGQVPAVGSASRAFPGRLGGLRVGRLLPTPRGTPFTFGYAVVLAAVSGLAGHTRPAVVRALHQASSTDVAHLARHPVLVLVASALWIVGGIASPYAIGFLLVLTALERRTGTAWAAGVFLLGHVVATLATEVPVGLAVLAGGLPVGSLHRLDYGISFGVAASVGSLAGLLSPWLRWPLLIGFGSVLAEDLILLTDPVTDGGHLIALGIGIATWPLVRRQRQHQQRQRGHESRHRDRLPGPVARP